MESLLADKIQSYIMSLLGKQVSVIDNKGRIIASGHKKRLGEKVNIPEEAYSEDYGYAFIDQGKPATAMPLFNNGILNGLLIIDDNPQKLKPQMPLLKSLSELLTQQYFDGLKPELDTTDKLINQLIYNFEPTKISFYTSQAKISGYQIDINRMAFIIHLDGFWQKYLQNRQQFADEKENIIMRKKRELERTIANFFTKDTDNITAYLGEDKFVIFKDISNTPEEKVVKLLQGNFKSIISPLLNFHIKSISAGIGHGRSGVTGMVKSYQEANMAMVLGRKMWGGDKAYYFDDLGVLSIIGIGNREKKVQFADRVLANLKDEDLIETLKVFFRENLNLTKTAEKMKIHRNTVIYRLEQITKILGRDPSNFEEALEIKLAMLIKQLY